MYFTVNFKVVYKLIVHLLVNELYIYQNAGFNNKNCTRFLCGNNEVGAILEAVTFISRRGTELVELYL